MEYVSHLAVTLGLSTIVITWLAAAFIHTAPGLRQMGLMSSQTLHLFWTGDYLAQRAALFLRKTCRVHCLKNKMHLNSRKRKFPH